MGGGDTEEGHRRHPSWGPGGAVDSLDVGVLTEGPALSAWPYGDAELWEDPRGTGHLREAGEAKVGNFDAKRAVDQQVLALEVAVDEV